MENSGPAEAKGAFSISGNNNGKNSGQPGEDRILDIYLSEQENPDLPIEIQGSY